MATKMGTQTSYGFTPDRFYMPRVWLSMYNCVFLLAIWYKCSQGRQEKQELEYAFFRRTESIMETMKKVLEPEQFTMPAMPMNLTKLIPGV